MDKRSIAGICALISAVFFGFILGHYFVLPSNFSFAKIAMSVANKHEYSENFNCVNFSEALVRELEDAGYQAKIVYGKWSNGEAEDYHAWVIVEVPIESTTGEIITPAEYEKAYKVIG